MAAKKLAKGKALKRLSGSTYVAIPQLFSIPLEFGEAEDVDTTAHDDSSTGYRTYLQGWKVPPTLEISGRWDPNDTQHAWLLTNHGGSAQSFQITIPSTTPMTASFSALIQNLKVPDDLSGPLDFSFTLRITGAVTLA